MPANLTPEYRNAEAAYRKAADPRERLDHLKEMLRVVPKHKGTDHLQAEIKTRIKELTAEIRTSGKAGARTGPATSVPPEGAAQISLLGPPNSGKSTLHGVLTGSQSETGPYPFTTLYPQPGMYVFDEVQFQLIDLPALSPQHPVPWIVNALQPSDGALFVVDVADPSCVDLVAGALEVLAARRIELIGHWPADPPTDGRDDAASFTLRIPALTVVTKREASADWRDELRALGELTGLDLPGLHLSAATGTGLDAIGRWLVDKLEIVRVYTKIPGQPADLSRPFTVRRGQTVADVARLVHREMAEAVRYARVWERDGFAGRQVGREHPVSDGDVLELHV